MSSTPLIIIAGAPSESARRLDNVIGQSARLQTLGPQLENLDQHVEVSRATLVILSAGDSPAEAIEATRRIALRNIPVLFLAKEKDADLILAAMRAGATEFAVEGQDEELRHAAAHLALRGTGRSLGRITSVYPTKGGVGATAIATNLAAALHRAGVERVCVVDLDLQFGDVLSFLDLQGAYSIGDVITNIRRLDRELLDSSVTLHRSGIFVLAQSDRIEQAETIVGDDIAMLFQFLRQHYDHVVVDGLRGLDDVTVSALDESDRILLLLTQDVPAVRNAQRCVNIFQRLNYPLDKMTLVVNRFEKKSTITMDVISETAGLPRGIPLANDFAPLIDAINHGVILTEATPRSRLAQSIADLLPIVCDEPAVRTRPRSLMSLFTRRPVTDAAQ